MKILNISDTHSSHQKIPLEWLDNQNGEIEMLIHNGDVSNRGHKQEVKEFLDWFSKLDFNYLIFIPGNHDFFFETASKKEIKKLMDDYPNVTYLNDNSIEIESINIHGTPISPFFYNWAFNRQRGEDIKKHWDLINENCDILIVHGPPHGLNDMVPDGDFVGCIDLLETIENRLINVKVVLSGHIHCAKGHVYKDGKLFVNASILNEAYRVAHKPTLIEYDKENNTAFVLE